MSNLFQYEEGNLFQYEEQGVKLDSQQKPEGVLASMVPESRPLVRESNVLNTPPVQAEIKPSPSTIFRSDNPLLNSVLGIPRALESGAIQTAQAVAGSMYDVNPNVSRETMRSLAEREQALRLAGGKQADFEQGAGSMVALAPLVSTTPAAMAFGAGVLAGGPAYFEAREKGIGPAGSSAYAAGQGGLEYLTERIPLGLLFGKAGGGVADRLLKATVPEITSEQIATLTQDALRQAVITPEKSWDEYWNERGQAALQTLKATAGGLGAAGAIMQAQQAFTPNEVKFADALQKEVDAQDTIPVRDPVPIYKGMQDASQIKSTDTSMLLQERPEVGLQEDAGTYAQPEEAATESKNQKIGIEFTNPVQSTTLSGVTQYQINGDGNNIGSIKVKEENGKPVSLVDVRINESEQGLGTGRAVVEKLLNQSNGSLYIYDMLPSSVGFWKRVGVLPEEGGKWEHGNGVLTKQRFEESSMPENGQVNAPGVAYSGLRNDTITPYAPTSLPNDKPITREEVLRPLLEAFGVPLYQGRVKGNKRLGFYMPKKEVVRIKKMSDLEVASHELAHLLDDRIPEIRKAWQTNSDFVKELKSVSYDSSKIYEGFAEFVRLYMTQTGDAKIKAPKFYAWFESFLGRNQYGQAIKQAQTDMTAWYKQDAVIRAMSKIGIQDALNDVNDSWKDNFKQSITDDLSGIEKMERDTTGKLEPNGAYESARLVRAASSIADGAIQYGYPVLLPNGDYEYQGKGLVEILKQMGGNTNEGLLYFVGRSANELKAQGRENLFTREEIDGMLKLKKPEYDKAFEEYQVWNKGILDFAEGQGVINPESRKLWKRAEYLPFWRESGGSKKGRGAKPGQWSGVKRLTGGTENLRDILSNMIGNAQMLIEASVKNEARTKIAELATKKGGGKYMVKIAPDSRLVNIDSEQIYRKILNSVGLDQASLKFAPIEVQMFADDVRKNLDEYTRLWQFGQPPKGSNVVAVMDGGKPVWYEVVDPILYRSLESIDRKPREFVVKLLSIPKQVGQLSVTLTPDFMIANIARDTLMGSIMSQAGFRPVIDSLKGMNSRLKADKEYRDAIANGIGMSSIYLDEDVLKRRVERIAHGHGIDVKTLLHTPGRMLDFVELVADSFEMSTRIGEYKREVEKGSSKRHAAYLGREVSTDFAMRGDSQTAAFLYDTVIFLKAAVVSIDRMRRGLSTDVNKRNIAAKIGMVGLMSMALYLLNKDNDEYNDMPDWKKDAYWHFFIGGKHFMYPKLWEVGAVGTIAERTTEHILGKGQNNLAEDLFRILRTTFGLDFTPQVVKPLVEQMANKSFFTGSSIETPSMENLQPFLRSGSNTSETMKAIGMATADLPEALQFNPVRAESLLRGYFNTWALYGLQLSDWALFDERIPSKRFDELPVIRRFYTEEPAKHNRYEQGFYDLLEEARRLHGTVRQLDKMGVKELADTKDQEKLASEYKALEASHKNIMAINKEMNMVRMSKITKEEKRKKLDELTKEKNDMFKRIVKESKRE